MRMDVHLDQVHIPSSTKWAVGVLLVGIAGLVSWNLLTTLAIRESQANDKREIWIEIGKQQGQLEVVKVQVNALESKVQKLEDRR